MSEQASFQSWWSGSEFNFGFMTYSPNTYSPNAVNSFTSLDDDSNFFKNSTMKLNLLKMNLMSGIVRSEFTYADPTLRSTGWLISGNDHIKFVLDLKVVECDSQELTHDSSFEKNMDLQSRIKSFYQNDFSEADYNSCLLKVVASSEQDSFQNLNSKNLISSQVGWITQIHFDTETNYNWEEVWFRVFLIIKKYDFNY